jgi:ABC-type uncharacterized transport system.
MKNNIVKKITGKRSFRRGAYAMVITAGFIVVVILLNIIATAVDKYFDNKIDLTENQLFSISEESEEYLKTVKHDITIKVLASEASFESGSGYGQGSNLFKHLHAVLNKYRAMCPKITIEYTDFYTNPGIAAKYPNDTLAQADIIVESRLRHKVINPNDIFTDGSTDGSNNLTISNAEQYITSAVLFVDDETPVSVGIITGHRESAIDYFSNILVKNNYSPITLSLLTDNIPENTKFLILNAPKVDFTEDEVKILESFLENGGKYGNNIIYTSSSWQGEMPNLDAFLENWGLAIDTTNVIYETDSRVVYGGNPNLPLLNVIDSDLVSSSFDYTGMKVAAQGYANVVEALFSQQASKTVSPFLKTTPTVVLQPSNEITNGKWSYAGSTRKEMNVGLVSQFDKTESSGEILSSRVFAIGGEGVFSDSVMTYSLFVNPQMFLAIFANCTGKQDVVQIAPKQIGTTSLGINKAAADAITIIFLWVIPAVIVAIGIVIFVRRRKL